jgi:NADH dehydrogenase
MAMPFSSSAFLTRRISPGLSSTSVIRAMTSSGCGCRAAGRHAGENINRLLNGDQAKPFTYFDKGTMATIGRGAAVVELPGHGTMTGHAAWLAWLGVHAALLSGGEEKSTTIVDWGWNMLTKKRGKRILVSDEDIEAEAAKG